MLTVQGGAVQLKMVRPLSGIQRQALSLYRSTLRVARQREGGLGGPLAAYARQEFERHRGVDRLNFQLIEHLIRKGRKQLEVLSQADVTGLQVKQAEQQQQQQQQSKQQEPLQRDRRG